MKTGFARASLLFLLSGAMALAQQTTVTYGYSGLPVPIFTDASNVISVATVFVPKALSISKVTVQVQIAYPNSGDLKLYLFSPEGTRTILLEHDCSVANVDTTFDDAAGSNWKDFCPTEAGRGPFRSDQPLSNFNNDDSSYGTWRLAVENDQSDSRSGWLNTFAVTITGNSQVGPEVRASTVVNAAGATNPGTVAPGEMVEIFGANLGPVPSVTAPAGALPTTLGGVSVQINGVAMPLAYVSPFVITAQVPFGLSPSGTVGLQVNNNSSLSPTITLTAATAAPGIYTNGPLGTGSVSAINPDGTINSVLNPVAKSGYIIAYASGLGTVNPSLVAGAVPPANPLSYVTGNVTAVIGGLPATVLYAGAAPGYPGLYQLNISIPAGVSSGQNEVDLFVNGIAAQSGATIQVR
ncbi:MAG TPA: proprotein convertase P-domain-containing protein [Bryobacteraceae bacterium]|nr:proprotein convertase P-domain-containing protein [Bryobacteraceae bacterium]